MHGKSAFDKNYYQRFFKLYNLHELNHYERWFEGWIGFLQRYISLKEGKGKKVLEVGCSLGYFANLLKKRNFDVVATDISSFIVKKAKVLHPDIVFLRLDVEKEIKIKGEFDYIFSFEVLEHLKDPERALQNIRKKLKREGIFVFSTPSPSSRSLEDPTHINVNSQKWWLETGKKAGFRKRRLVYASFIPFLYRFSGFLSRGFPFKTNLPYINSTCFFFFER